MNAKARRAFGEVSCDVRFNEPLAKYGTYRIGGPADVVARPKTVDDVIAIVELGSQLEIPWLAIGLGSNVLFDDDGFRGIIIRIATTLAETSQHGAEGARWTVGAGLPIPRFAKTTAARGLGGVHRLIGVPGAVGGGVFMNAGAHGQDFATVVKQVTLVSDAGQIETREGSSIPWRYRTSGLNGIVIEATMDLEPSDPLLLRRELTECINRRRAGTPFDQPCCGSVFRNPAPQETAHLPSRTTWTAGRLIEAAGLKNHQAGGARVSSMHANYIVNVGGATAADVKSVIDDVQREVEDRFDVRLNREVKFVTPVGMETPTAAE